MTAECSAMRLVNHLILCSQCCTECQKLLKLTLYWRDLRFSLAALERLAVCLPQSYWEHSGMIFWWNDQSVWRVTSTNWTIKIISSTSQQVHVQGGLAYKTTKSGLSREMGTVLLKHLGNNVMLRHKFKSK